MVNAFGHAVGSRAVLRHRANWVTSIDKEVFT
jgi:hypothetical protein